MDKRGVQRGLWLLLLLCPFWTLLAQNGATSTPALMPPLRRVGVDVAGQNIADFRQYFQRESRKLAGVAASPLSSLEVGREISFRLERSLQRTGRFWVMTLDPLADFYENPSPSEVSATKRRLEASYDLDAWVVPWVHLGADETLVRVYVRGTGPQAPILAREDLSLEPQPSAAALESAFDALLARIQSTLGHEGRITWQREELVTIDFGLERGLTRGQRLRAGWVVLWAWHPQSGEYMRARRVEVLELEVVDPKRGSSLCRVVGVDDKGQQMGKQWLGAQSQAPLLVWAPGETVAKGPWKEPWNPDVPPALGAAEEGFVRGTPAPVGIHTPAPEAEPNVALRPTPAPTLPPGFTPPLPPGSRRAPRLEDPSTWRFEAAELGAEEVYGTLSTNKGSRGTGFPTTLLNGLRLGTEVQVDEGMLLGGGLAAQYYGFGVVTGSGMGLDIHLLSEVWKKPGSDQTLLGGSVELRQGKVKNSLESLALDGFAFAFRARHLHSEFSLGQLQADMGVSVFDLLGGSLVGDAELSGRHPKWLPPPLRWFARARLGPPKWMELGVGFMWDFLPQLPLPQ